MAKTSILKSKEGGARFTLPDAQTCSKDLIIIIFIFWLRFVFVSARGISLVAESGGYSSLRCTGFSLRWLLLLQSMGSRRPGFSSCSTQAQSLRCEGSRAHRLQQLWCAGLVVVAHRLQSTSSVVVAHGFSCSVACGIFPDQGSNPFPLHWQADSQPLHHQGSPNNNNFLKKLCRYRKRPMIQTRESKNK